MDPQLVAAPACLQEAVIACAGAAGAVAAPLPPDPLHPLVIHGPTFQPEPPVDQSPTPANMTPGQLPVAPAQLLLVNRRHRYGAGAECCGSDPPTGRLDAGTPGIDPAEHRQLCDVAPGSEVSLG